jgi:hypothetical protein
MENLGFDTLGFPHSNIYILLHHFYHILPSRIIFLELNLQTSETNKNFNSTESRARTCNLCWFFMGYYRLKEFFLLSFESLFIEMLPVCKRASYSMCYQYCFISNIVARREISDNYTNVLCLVQEKRIIKTENVNQSINKKEKRCVYEWKEIRIFVLCVLNLVEQLLFVVNYKTNSLCGCVITKEITFRLKEILKGFINIFFSLLPANALSMFLSVPFSQELYCSFYELKKSKIEWSIYAYWKEKKNFEKPEKQQQNKLSKSKVLQEISSNLHLIFIVRVRAGKSFSIFNAGKPKNIDFFVVFLLRQSFMVFYD